MSAGYVLTWFLAKPEQFASFSHIIIDEAQPWTCWLRLLWLWPLHVGTSNAVVLYCFHLFPSLAMSCTELSKRSALFQVHERGADMELFLLLTKLLMYFFPRPKAEQRRCCRVWFSDISQYYPSMCTWHHKTLKFCLQVILMSATMQPEEFSNWTGCNVFSFLAFSFSHLSVLCVCSCANNGYPSTLEPSGNLRQLWHTFDIWVTDKIIVIQIQFCFALAFLRLNNLHNR